MAAHRNARISAVLLLTIFSVIVGAAAPAQNVPATAREAAKLPQFASRLAHGATGPVASRAYRPQPSASFKNPGDRRALNHRGSPLDDNVLYDNGPINGTTDAWTINSGFVVSDTLAIPSGADPVTGMNFGAWLEPGDVLESVQISITSSEFGGTTYFNGVVNFTQSGCSNNQYGFNVCTETSSNFSGPNLAAATYWVNLSNAVVNTGDPVYWDENSGVGCDSPGCPSLASETSTGTIPSEAFSILAASTCDSPVEERPTNAAKVVTVPPSPTQTYRVIYNFTGAGDGGNPAGLAVDAAGNLYGTTGSGGPFGAGTAFKLSPRSSGWLFNRLYSFAANGGSSSTLVLGADGTLFGTSYGGVHGDGALFSLSPPGNISPSVFSNWMESLLYSFTGGSDGADPGGSLVLDSSGNIYGNAGGGADGQGILYEFTNGGIQVLHAFPAFPGDGANPIGAVNGLGGLYGLTTGGGDAGWGTLYTTAGGYQVIFSFITGLDGRSVTPIDLAADQAGNLFVTSSGVTCVGIAGERVAEFSPPGWGGQNLVSWYGGAFLGVWVSTDALGNVYGTTNGQGQYSLGNAFELTCCWNYTDLHDFSGGNDGAMPGTAPVVDAQGNIYGTTSQGGTYGQGVVWEISP